jgi:hypothetical protein
MARLRRRWRVVKWAFLILSLLIAVMWAASIPNWFGYQTVNGMYRFNVYVNKGLLASSYTVTDYNPETVYDLETGVDDCVEGWRVVTVPLGWPGWKASFERKPSEYLNGWLVALPLWIPFVVLVLTAAVVHRLDRQPIRTDHCHNCGGDVAATSSSGCPRCGANVKSDSTSGGQSLGAARSRKRRFRKWCGLAMLLLIGFGWAVSIFWEWGCLKWTSSEDYLLGRLTSGSVIAEWDSLDPNYPPPSRFYVEENNEALIWNPEYQVGPAMTWTVVLPLWIPFLIVAFPTAYFWWRDRRRIPPGHCQNCGYDLTGNVSGICPECGERVETLSRS